MFLTSVEELASRLRGYIQHWFGRAQSIAISRVQSREGNLTKNINKMGKAGDNTVIAAKIMA